MAARYTVKFVAGERRDSLLVLLATTLSCSALNDAARNRLVTAKTTIPHADLSEIDATLHLEEPDGPELYAAGTLFDVVPGATEIVVVVFEVSSLSTFALTQDSSAILALH